MAHTLATSVLDSVADTADATGYLMSDTGAPVPVDPALLFHDSTPNTAPGTPQQQQPTHEPAPTPGRLTIKLPPPSAMAHSLRRSTRNRGASGSVNASGSEYEEDAEGEVDAIGEDDDEATSPPPTNKTRASSRGLLPLTSIQGISTSMRMRRSAWSRRSFLPPNEEPI